MSHKSVFIAKIAAELAEIRRELRRLAASTSPTKDGASLKSTLSFVFIQGVAAGLIIIL